MVKPLLCTQEWYAPRTPKHLLRSFTFTSFSCPAGRHAMMSDLYNKCNTHRSTCRITGVQIQSCWCDQLWSESMLWPHCPLYVDRTGTKGTRPHSSSLHIGSFVFCEKASAPLYLTPSPLCDCIFFFLLLKFIFFVTSVSKTFVVKMLHQSDLFACHASLFYHSFYKDVIKCTCFKLTHWLSECHVVNVAEKLVKVVDGHVFVMVKIRIWGPGNACQWGSSLV